MSHCKVEGVCPMGCGSTLFVGDGGHVTCGYLPCPDPTAASRALANSEAVERHYRDLLALTFRLGGPQWTIVETTGDDV